MDTSTHPRAARLRRTLIGCTVAVLTTGCASTGPLIKKEAFDFVTTGLFMEPCSEAPDVKAAKRASRKAKKGYVNGATNECNLPDMDAMVTAFMAIQEADEKRGLHGETIEEVRERGFTIYTDKLGRIRRPNTRVLHGNDALAAVGMGVSAPPLQKPEEIQAYTQYMGQLYAEEYVERDIMRSADRMCINNRESLDTGDERTFAILFRGGRVVKRVVKGGPINNPKRERAFLLCPGSFISDTISGNVSRTLNTLTPLK